jgi:tetrahydrodipicolinate N-succinyltransferase
VVGAGVGEAMGVGVSVAAGVGVTIDVGVGVAAGVVVLQPVSTSIRDNAIKRAPDSMSFRIFILLYTRVLVIYRFIYCKRVRGKSLSASLLHELFE